MHLIFLMYLFLCPVILYSQQSTKDTVIYKITYRDTVIYRYETVLIKQFVYSDTIRSTDVATSSGIPEKKKKAFNANNWGIGPSLAAYYSPYHGFDIAIGFGVQYYLFAVPSFRTPHMARKSKK
jgi:hypothetical protein